MFDDIELPFLIKIYFRMKINNIMTFLLALLVLAGCGQSDEEKKRLSIEEKMRQNRLDSLAFKVGVLPSLDCLPVYVAKEEGLFDSLDVDIRLRHFDARMDCDAAMASGKLQGAFSDIVSCQRLVKQGVALKYATSTNAYWILVSNRLARIKHIRQLKDKMMAMTRYSATDLLGDYAVDSVKIPSDEVFRIQINDPGVRLGMLLNNEMDAMFLSEPHATTARINKHVQLMDSRDKDLWLGVVALRRADLADKRRSNQAEAFIKGYDKACDMINRNGVKHYSDVICKYCNVDAKTVAALPDIKYKHAAEPRIKDLETAERWLKNK